MAASDDLPTKAGGLRLGILALRQAAYTLGPHSMYPERLVAFKGLVEPVAPDAVKELADFGAPLLQVHETPRGKVLPNCSAGQAAPLLLLAALTDVGRGIALLPSLEGSRRRLDAAGASFSPVGITPKYDDRGVYVGERTISDLRAVNEESLKGKRSSGRWWA